MKLLFKTTGVFVVLPILLFSFVALTRPNSTRTVEPSAKFNISPTPPEQFVISEEDKKSIIISILKATDFLHSSDHEVEKSSILYLSKENLPNSFLNSTLPEIKGVSKIVFITPDTSKKASENKTTYWEFRGFKILKNKISVSLLVFYADGNSSWGVYEYEKDARGQWQVKAVDYGAAAS